MKGRGQRLGARGPGVGGRGLSGKKETASEKRTENGKGKKK